MLHVLVHAHCAADNILRLLLNISQIGKSRTAVSLFSIFHRADEKWLSYSRWEVQTRICHNAGLVSGWQLICYIWYIRILDSMKAGALHWPMCHACPIPFTSADRPVSLISLDTHTKQGSSRLIISQVAVAWHICKHMQALSCVYACKCAECFTHLVTIGLSCRQMLH